MLKRVELGAVLATDPDLLLLDEPTSGMGPEEAHAFGDTLLELRREFDLTVVMIEHHVPLVAQVCDYVYCLNFGELLAEGTPDQVRSDPEVIRAYLGQEADEVLRGASMSLLEVEGLRVGYGFPVLMGISFTVEEGETAVIFGLNGAGKTTTVATVAGLLKPEAGTIRFDGTDITRMSAAERVALGHRPRARGPAGLPRAVGVEQPAARRLDETPPRQGDRGVPGHRASTTSPAWRSGRSRWPGRCRAASSRCWPSAGR